MLGIDKFGESAPEEDVFEAFGISSRTIVDSVLCLLGNDRNDLRGSMTSKGCDQRIWQNRKAIYEPISS